MKSLISAIFILATLVIPMTCFAGNYYNRGYYYYPYYYYYPVQQNVVIEKETFIIPKRVTSFLEVPGLQIVSDDYGTELIVIDGKIQYKLDNPVFLKEQKEVKDNKVESVRRVEVNGYGQTIITETREIRK